MPNETRMSQGIDPLDDPARWLEVIIRQITDHAIFTTDTSGRPRTWNEGVRRILGFESAEFIGAEISSTIFTPEAQAEKVPERELAQAAQTGQANDDRWMRRKDGTPFFAAGSTTATRDEQGQLVGFVKVVRDQTQWKNTQDELKRTNDELARTSQKRGEFIAVLAHELRNPLAPLGNGIQILKRSINDPARISATLPLVERQIEQMSRLIADLLDVSRIVHDRIELKRAPVDLASVIPQALEIVRPHLETVGHEISVADPAVPLYVDADAPRLVQVLVNLLNNAFKFTPPGGQIWISAELEESEGVIRIRDSGIGIPISEQSRIFEMFSQVDASRERSKGGLGIGLALVKRIVELHSGTVQVASAGRGMGSEFVIRLPLIEAPGRSRDTDTGAVDPATCCRRILVVDDNVDSAATLAELLEIEGHHASVANSGEEAIRTADLEKPELIVLDIGMPGMSGLRVAEHLRRQQREPIPIIVALTGWDQPDDRRAILESGFDYHLVKPVNVDALREILESMTPG